jgi:ribosomal-protein-alanine N-acetyltransferase
MTGFDSECTLFTIDLALEPILPAHAPLLFDDLQSHDLYAFIPNEPPKSVELLRARYERWSARQSEDGREVWLNYAVLRRVDHRYLGTVQATVHAGGTSSIAYEVFQPYRRRGMARAAVSTLIAHLLRDARIDCVSALVDTRNQPSWRLLEALGFRRVSTKENADHFKGERSDEYFYELCRE